MKHGKKPTVKQKKILKEYGLNYENWLIVKDNSFEMVIVHRHTDKVRTIKKGDCDDL